MRPVFFLRYPLRHLARERQRTAFVLFCIAVGVAAVVALRTLGLSISETLTSNLQTTNHGDIQVELPYLIDQVQNIAYLNDGTEVHLKNNLFENTDLGITLSRAGWTRMRNWAVTHRYAICPAWYDTGPTTRFFESGSHDAQMVMLYFVDPAQYPFYGSIQVLDPAGLTFAQALSHPYDVAVIEEVANKLHLRIGDEVYVAGVAKPFTVAAIVGRYNESNFPNLSSSLFPFIYLPYQTGEHLFHRFPNRLYLQLPSGGNAEAIARELEQEFPGITTRTTEDLRQSNQEMADMLTETVTVMGLVSLLIGGIGISNTMIVIIQRRALEIGVLKTLGVQGDQILLLFIVEALILGVIGSFLGVVLSYVLVLLLLGVGERFIDQTLHFSIYPEAIGIGIFLGVLITVSFSLLPILSANRVRPYVVLHPGNAMIPPAGRLVSLLVIMSLTAILGSIVGQITREPLIGLGLAYATLIILTLAILLLRTLMWGLSQLPSFGSVSFKLSQRALRNQSKRIASTLLALTVGIFTLSLILLLSRGALKLMENNLEQNVGGNLIVGVASEKVGRNLEKELAAMPGIRSYVRDTVYDARVIAINGNHKLEPLEQSARGLCPDGFDSSFFRNFSMKVLDENTWSYSIVEGRDLPHTYSTVANRRQILLEPPSYANTPAFQCLGLKPGDTLTFQFANGQQRTATIAGITSRHGSGLLSVSVRDTTGIVPSGFVPGGVLPRNPTYILKVDSSYFNQALIRIAGIKGTYAMAIEQLSVAVNRLASQLASLFIVMGGIALFASGTIIANTVSLTTLERRREIGILKAIGLHTENVLGLLLLENGLVGIIGGVCGTFAGVIVILQTGLLDQSQGLKNFPLEVLLFLVALSLTVALVATLLAAHSAVREKPLDVLRHEQ